VDVGSIGEFHEEFGVRGFSLAQDLLNDEYFLMLDIQRFDESRAYGQGLDGKRLQW
jgi:hypothetical protein